MVTCQDDDELVAPFRGQAQRLPMRRNGGLCRGVLFDHELHSLRGASVIRPMTAINGS